MMLKVATLTLADRQIINYVLNHLDEVKPETPSMAREFRKGFELRDATKKVDSMTDERVKKWLEELKKWDELTEDDQKYQIPPSTTPDGVKWDELNIMGKTFTIDESYLKWFGDILKDFDWTVIKNAQGESVKRVVDIQMLEAIANLSDAINFASYVKPVDSKEKK